MTQWKYSNAAMSMLGLVVQRVSGIPYEQFIAERLLQPLGMENTAFYPGPDCADRMALGHYMPPYQRRWEATPYQDLRSFNACGMLASTPSDLLQLARLQWSGRSCLSFGAAVARTRAYRQNRALNGVESKGLVMQAATYRIDVSTGVAVRFFPVPQRPNSLVR